LTTPEDDFDDMDDVGNDVDDVNDVDDAGHADKAAAAIAALEFIAKSLAEDPEPSRSRFPSARARSSCR